MQEILEFLEIDEILNSAGNTVQEEEDIPDMDVDDLEDDDDEVEDDEVEDDE